MEQISLYISLKDNIILLPSRFVGYLNNDLLTHLVKKNGKNGRETSPAIDSIIGHTRAFNQALEDEYLGFCDRLGITPKHMVNTQRKYWLLDNKQNKIYTEEYYEGSLQQALVNRYERNPIARKKCIEKHGVYVKFVEWILAKCMET